MGYGGKRGEAKDAARPADAGGGGCPVLHKDAQIDPRNNMPAPNQEPWPGQQAPLNTARVVSTIPKGDSDSNWDYPSEQMFYNALQRKGKGDGVSEAEVSTL
eukprot:SAG31_NODE_3292_length_4454_cov_2.328588_1_plen_102_part_00